MRNILLTTAALAALVAPAVPVSVKPVAAVAPEVHVHDHTTHVHVHDAEPQPIVDDVTATTAVRPSTVRPVAEPGAMFRTVEDAMRYLASAYNRNDRRALKHVTTPDARTELKNMRAIATDLRLESCTWDGGYYTCTFTHGYPRAKGSGKAWFSVAPARRPGWYMTVMEGCG